MRHRVVVGKTPALAGPLPNKIIQSSPYVRPRYSNGAQVLREEDLHAAPVSTDHKVLILRHLRRLNAILHQPYPTRMWILDKRSDKIEEVHLRKQAARRQLARMTIVFRRYIWQHSQGQLEDHEVESMVWDLVDASFHDDGSQALQSITAVVDPISVDDIGEQQEMESLVQDMVAENVDDVIELYNVDSGFEERTVVPDTDPVSHIGKDIEFSHSFARSQCDDDSIYHAQKARIRSQSIMRPEPLSEKFVVLKEKKWTCIKWP